MRVAGGGGAGQQPAFDPPVGEIAARQPTGSVAVGIELENHVAGVVGIAAGRRFDAVFRQVAVGIAIPGIGEAVAIHVAEALRQIVDSVAVAVVAVVEDPDPVDLEAAGSIDRIDPQRVDDAAPRRVAGEREFEHPPVAAAVIGRADPPRGGNPAGVAGPKQVDHGIDRCLEADREPVDRGRREVEVAVFNPRVAGRGAGQQARGNLGAVDG